MKKISSLFFISLICILLTTHESKAFYSQKGKAYAYGSFGYALSQVSVSVTTTPGGPSNNTSRRNYNKSIEIGVGKYITDAFRSDISAFVYVGKKKSGLSLTNLSGLRAKVRNYSLQWNFYYNMLNQSQVAPYVMAGLGFGQQEFNISGPLGSFSKTQGSLLYVIGAGIDWHLGAQWDLTFGYKLITLANSKGVNLGNYSIANYVANIKLNNNQTIMVGMRKVF